MPSARELRPQAPRRRARLTAFTLALGVACVAISLPMFAEAVTSPRTAPLDLGQGRDLVLAVLVEPEDALVRPFPGRPDVTFPTTTVEVVASLPRASTKVTCPNGRSRAGDSPIEGWTCDARGTVRGHPIIIWTAPSRPVSNAARTPTSFPFQANLPVTAALADVEPIDLRQTYSDGTTEVRRSALQLAVDVPAAPPAGVARPITDVVVALPAGWLGGPCTAVTATGVPAPGWRCVSEGPGAAPVLHFSGPVGGDAATRFLFEVTAAFPTEGGISLSAAIGPAAPTVAFNGAAVSAVAPVDLRYVDPVIAMRAVTPARRPDVSVPDARLPKFPSPSPLPTVTVTPKASNTPKPSRSPRPTVTVTASPSPAVTVTVAPAPPVAAATAAPVAPVPVAPIPLTPIPAPLVPTSAATPRALPPGTVPGPAPTCIPLAQLTAPPVISDLRTYGPTPTPATTTDPALTDPALTDPALTDPALTDPALTDPALTDPLATGPALADPSLAATPAESPVFVAAPPANLPVCDLPETGAGEGTFSLFKSALLLLVGGCVLLALGTAARRDPDWPGRYVRR